MFLWLGKAVAVTERNEEARRKRSTRLFAALRTTAMNFREAFQIEPGEVIAFVGGGGKTSLMFAMAKQLSQSYFVVTTTTTKIYAPTRNQSQRLMISDNESSLLDQTLAEPSGPGHITVAAGQAEAESKLIGVTPEFVDRLSRTKRVDVLLCEADGAKGRSLKFPNEDEPVIPLSTTLVVPVIGIDVLGLPFNEETVFRSHLTPEDVRPALGTPISAYLAAQLAMHPRGICKSAPKNARIIPFLNKVESKQADEHAEELAQHLLTNTLFRLESVVIGSIYEGHLRRNR